MQPVIAYPKKNQRRFIAELAAYVRFASVFAQPMPVNDVQACAKWLANHCR